MRIPINKAKELFLAYSAIQETVLDAILSGDKFVELPEWEYQLAQLEFSKCKAEKDSLEKCAKRNNKGLEYEKDGKIKLVIKQYEANISDGYPAHHSYKRLMVIYHKQKDLENEIRVIKRALEVFPNFPEYQKRLDKLQK